MNWKLGLVRCSLMSFGLALVGCGSAVDTGNKVSATATNDAAPQISESAEQTVLTDVSLVTLDLPGMT